MSEYKPTHNEIDDYIAELTDTEREELAMADAAIELAFLFHDAREGRGLTQAEAAQRAGLRQQAVSRFEQPDMKLAKTKIETLRKYFAALGYGVQIALKDLKSGGITTSVDLPPRPQRTNFHTVIVPWDKLRRGPTTANATVGVGGVNFQSKYALPLPKDTATISLLLGKWSTPAGSGSSINLPREPQELMETNG